MKKIALIIVLLFIFAGQARAFDIPRELLKNPDINRWGQNIQDGADIGKAQSNLWQRVLEEGKSQLSKALSTGLKILAVCAIFSVVTAFSKANSLGAGDRAVEMCAIALVIILCIGDANSILNECKRAVENVGVFSKVLMPNFVTLAAASGRGASSVAISGGAMIYTEAICSLATSWFFPLISIYVFAAMAGNIGGGNLAGGFASAMRGLMFWLVKLSLGGITFYMSIAGALGVAGDAVAVKTAKAAVSGLIPVVGTSIAGVAEGVLAGAAGVRNTVGVMGIIALLGVALGPFVRLAIGMGIFRCLSFVAASLSSAPLAKCISAVGDGYAMALGVLASACGGIIMAVVLCISVFGGV